MNLQHYAAATDSSEQFSDSMYMLTLRMPIHSQHSIRINIWVYLLLARSNSIINPIYSLNHNFKELKQQNSKPEMSQAYVSKLNIQCF